MTGGAAMMSDRAAEGQISSSVKENCPAFLDGCPYATSAEILDWVKAQRPDVIEKCPGFKEGCPFREVQNMSGLQHALQDLPPSHAGPEDTTSKSNDAVEMHATDVSSTAVTDCDVQGQTTLKAQQGSPRSAHGALVHMLQVVHQASQSVKETVGGDCPVFQQSCPFKNCLTSAGTALVLELETRSWVLMTLDKDGFEGTVGDMNEEVAVNNTESSTGHVDTAGSVEERPGAKVETYDEDEVMMGLAMKLKEGTKVAHKAAESGHFVREFFKGKVTREVYRQMVVNLFHVYKAIEDALDRCSEHELVEPLYFPEELNRAKTLREDARYFWGDDWEERSKPSPVTLEYVARLNEIARTSPELLVPHAYTRYLGDLSGGQLLKRAAIRGFKLPKDTGEGVSFYTFKRVPDVKVFKNMYRARLDSLPADATIADAMVVEANYAFDLNTRMFHELDELAGFGPPASSPPQAEAAPAKGTAGKVTIVKDSVACPFAALAGIVPMPADHPPTDSAADKPARKASKIQVAEGHGRHSATKTVGDKSSKEAKSASASKVSYARVERHGIKQGALLFAAFAVVLIAWIGASYTTNFP